ncbi:FadR/GntR family transcriptional regulator [Aquihabitans sp. McL0605]|uniref:FadR/GntR family transcriptional regulator n=1 Tax=Aquihabitans sp. McL0605 TaxID=3415671 RepID=UPI003CF32412
MAAPDDAASTAPAATRRTRVQQPRVGELVAAELRRRILASGDEQYALPTQDQLVQEFGVSYPSVREAVRILETEGLVTVRRGKIGGLETHRPDERSAAYHLGLVLQGDGVSVADLAGALQQLEPLGAAACAGRADRKRAVLPLLRDNIERSAELVSDGVDFTHTAREFHDLVVACTPNATLRSVIRSLVALWSAQEEAWAESRSSRGEYPSVAEARAVVRTHGRIADAIEAGDAAEAERLVRVHVAATQDLVLADDPEGVVDAAYARRRGAEPTLDSGRL